MDGKGVVYIINYVNTFIRVAEDCPAAEGIVPVGRGDRKTIAVIQYELLVENPYRLTQEDVLFESYARHKAVPPEARTAARAEFFARSQACLRASPLPKQYGWGLHFDEAGRVALCGVNTEEYRRFAEGEGLTVLKAMRSKRA